MADEVYVIGSNSPTEKSDIPECVSCTACNKGLKIIKRKVFKHPRLNVLLCKGCLKFINSNEFTKDEQGIEEYCTWCGDGGNLVCCDFCEKAYCKHCVKRNLGKEFLKTLLNAPDDSKWKCFYCDNGQIITFVDECKSIIDHVKSLTAREEEERTTPRPPAKAKESISSKHTNVKSTITTTTITSTTTTTTTKSTTNKSSTNQPTCKSTATNGSSASSKSNSQLERRRRLQEVAKQVENVSAERVGFKSSFPRYEISDDDDNDAHGQNDSSNEIDCKNNILRLSSTVPVARNPAKDETQNAIQIPVIDKLDGNVSGNENSKSMQGDTTAKRKSLSSVLEKLRSDASAVSNSIDDDDDDDDDEHSSQHTKKHVNNDLKETQKDDRKDSLKCTKKDGEGQTSDRKKKSDASKTVSEKKVKSKSEGKDEEKSKCREKSKKKKQTILMISSSEGSDEEIVVMSKSGKRRVISKSILRLAQSAIEEKESKKSGKDDKPQKKTKDVQSVKKKKKLLSDSSSSEDEKSSSDDSDSDDEPLISKVKTKSSSKALKDTPVAESKSKDSEVDEQQPGPSGVRPKNKLQRSKLGQPRQVVTSESSDEDNYVPKSGILSKKFRQREETTGEANVDVTLVCEKNSGECRINKEDNENIDDNIAAEVSSSTSTVKKKVATKDTEVDAVMDTQLTKEFSDKGEVIVSHDGMNSSTLVVDVAGNKNDGNKDDNSNDIEVTTDMIIIQVINDLCNVVAGTGKTKKKDDISVVDRNSTGAKEKNYKPGALGERLGKEAATTLEPDIKINSDSDDQPLKYTDLLILDSANEDSEVTKDIMGNELPVIKDSVKEHSSTLKFDSGTETSQVKSDMTSKTCIEMDSDAENVTLEAEGDKKRNKKEGTEIINTNPDDGSIDKKTEEKKKNLVNISKKNSTDGEGRPMEIDFNLDDEVVIETKTKEKNMKPNKMIEIGNSDSEDETTVKKKGKAKESNKKKKNSTDSDDEILVRKKSKTKEKDKKSKEINSTDSEGETVKKKNGGRETDSEDESPLERRVSKRKRKKIGTGNNTKENKGSESESSVEVKSRRSKRKKANNDDDSDSEIPLKKLSKRKYESSSEESNGSDSESDVGKKKQSRLKKNKRKVRHDSSAKENASASSSSDDDDDDDVDLDKLESDSSSTDGSIIITRKSKRQKVKEKEKSKKNKKRSKKKQEKKNNSDTEEEEEGEEATPSKGGRKKIRTIMKDTELDEETRKAQKAEEERRKRLLERTKAERDEVNIAINVVDGDFILEKNENKDPLVAVLSEINQHLKPHQRKGIQFMYDCLIETVASFKKGDPGGGCLLAHCMGLGKTLQVVALVHTVMNNTNIKMERFLVVCPLNTVLNWENEFGKWIPDEPEDEKPYIYVLSYCNGLKDRVGMLKDWFKKGGVLITGYEMYRNLVTGKSMKSKKMKGDVKECLSDPGPDLVICDEGHILKNDQTAISKAMSAISTKRRVVLTGTPLQNNLLEYHCMVDFVKPKLLGTRKEYQNRFVNPILNGQCSNSTSSDVRVMKQRCHVLYQLLAGCVQRQDYSVLTPFLPQKREYTIFVRLGEKQIKMYEHFLEQFVYRDSATQRARSSLFADFQCLSRIWSHPWCLHIDRVKAVHRDRNKYNSDDEFLDDEEQDTTSESDDDKGKGWNADTSSDEDAKEQKRRQRRRKAVSSDSSDNSSEDEKPTQAETNKPSRSARSTRSTAAKENDSKENGGSKSDCDGDDDEITTVQPNTETVAGRGNLRSGVNFKDGSLNPEHEKEDEEYETAWFDQFLELEDERNVELGGKLVLLLEILANAEAVGDKILVFSQSLTTLDLIEKALTSGMFEGDHLCWMHGVDYFRMDGSTPVSRRKRWADIFNDPENEQCRLFLISTRAGSLGINMVGANRVIVFDCSWNPSHDVQSVFRVYRFGQEKPVYVYRFIAQGTMEEKIYGRQITKLATAGRVVDEQQIGRHFTDEEIRELYTFSPEKIEDNVETPQLPKDPLLAEVLQRLHPKFIVRYHEHDLLLENVEAEELSEEERKLAWKSYEDEKEGAAKKLDFRNFVPPPATHRFMAPQLNTNFQQFSDPFRLVNDVGAGPGFQRQRYTISYPPEMSVEQRQQALLELRQREVMRLLIQQRSQQTMSGGSTIISSNHINRNVGNGYRHVRLQNIAPRPVSSLSSSYRHMPGANISARPISSNYINNATTNNSAMSSASVIHTATTSKPSESHQGGYLAKKKVRPTHYDIT